MQIDIFNIDKYDDDINDDMSALIIMFDKIEMSEICHRKVLFEISLVRFLS